MQKLDIISPPHTTLRKKAAVVEQIKDSELQALINDMIFTMRAANGVGLAAPQVNRSLRVAVIETPPDIDEEGNEIEGTRTLYVIINPEITWKSRKMTTGIEGCLSIPGYVGEVGRHQAIHVRALDRNGRRQTYKLKGWTARIFQHEIDHLDGVLYTDRLTAPENYWTEEEFEAMQEEARQEQQEEAPEEVQL